MASAEQSLLLLLERKKRRKLKRQLAALSARLEAMVAYAGQLESQVAELNQELFKRRVAEMIVVEIQRLLAEPGSSLTIERENLEPSLLQWLEAK